MEEHEKRQRIGNLFSPPRPVLTPSETYLLTTLEQLVAACEAGQPHPEQVRGAKRVIDEYRGRKP